MRKNFSTKYKNQGQFLVSTLFKSEFSIHLVAQAGWMMPFTPILSLWNSPLGESRKAEFPGGHPGGGGAPQTRPPPRLHLTGYRATWKRVLAPQIRALTGAWKLSQPCSRGLGPPHPPRSGCSGECYLS